MKRIQCAFLSFVLSMVLLVLGCQQARVSGHDPLLGKMRVDPPATSARSVYVERKNVQEGGLLPSDTEAIVKMPAGAAKGKSGSEKSEPVQTASEKRVSVHKVPIQIDGEAAVENVSEISRDKNVSQTVNSSHLRWRSVGVSAPASSSKDPEPHSCQIENARKPAAVVRELTQEELVNYRYTYDFSTIPPRKVPLDLEGQEPFSEMPEEAETALRREMDLPGQKFYGNDFDPYASHHEFDLKRMEVSRRFEMEFKAQDAEKMRSVPRQAERADAVSEVCGLTVGECSAADRETRAEGWRIVSSHRDPGNVEAASEMETAPLQSRVGSRVQVDPASVSSVSDNSRKSVPTSVSGGKRKASVELLDLPK